VTPCSTRAKPPTLHAPPSIDIDAHSFAVVGVVDMKDCMAKLGSAAEVGDT